MILNTYALLAGSVALLRLLLGVGAGILGWSVWRRWRASASSEQRTALEDRSYLLFLQACFLAGLNVVSWPLLYLVLQSYVPQWPGVMCIYGVTRIGVGSAGPSGYLPRLLGLLQALKPALVFLTGAWLVLYSVHRRSQTAWLLRPILGTLLLVGLVSSLDAAAEIAYLTLPKKNESLSNGCCPVPDAFTAALSDHNANATHSPQAWLFPAYLALNIATVLGLRHYQAHHSNQRGFWSFAPLVLLAAANFGISLNFMAQVVCPAILGGPGHHCLYDLIPRAPFVVLALALLAWGSLCVGWTAVAGRLAGNAETSGFIGKRIGGLARRGQYAYVVSMALIVGALLGARS